MTNFFSAIRESVFGGIVSSIVDFIKGLFETAAGIQLLPFASMLGFFLNLLIDAVCSLMTLVGQGTLGLFEPNIGTGKSLFEIVIGSIEKYNQAFQIISMSMLFLLYLINIIRVMATPPSESDDTPGFLTAKTILAGFFIGWAPDIIIFFETKFFNPFYMFILGQKSAEEFDFSSFATTAQHYISTGYENGLSIEAQVASIAACMLLSILVLLICVRFIAYAFEAAQRYVVMGFLIITSPLAFCLAPSKRTQRSFTAWVRMVICEMILLVTNVLFLSIFFSSFAKFGPVVDRIGGNGAERVGVVVVWALLMYGVLYAGQQFDTYLKSLGLNVAQTGTGMMEVLVDDMALIGVTNPGTIINDFKNCSKAFSGFAGSTLSKAIPFYKDVTGAATAASINAAVESKSTYAVKSNSLGRGVISSIRGIPVKQAQRLDPNSAIMEDGIIHMTTPPRISAEGIPQKMTVDFIPLSWLTQHDKDVGYGRSVSIGNKPYVAVATGDGALAFNTSNPKMKALLEERYGKGSVSEVKKESGEGSGVWRMYSVSDDGRTGIVREWAPTSCYEPDRTLGGKTERIGSMDYFAYTIVRPLSEKGGHFVTRCEQPIIPTEVKDKIQWFDSQFQTSQEFGAAVSDVIDFKNGIIAYEDLGQCKVMAPVAEYSLNNNSYDGRIITARNGAEYFTVNIPADLDAQKTAAAIFTSRETEADGAPMWGHLHKPFAQEKDWRRGYVPESEILKTAQKKKRGTE